MEVPSHDPEHAVLPRAFEWEIVGMNWQAEPNDQADPYLELTLRRRGDRRILRFYRPRELEIEKGGPAFTGGLAIYDVSARGLEDMRVRVGDFEASHGAISFWARDVVDVSETAER